jgi:DNA-directed RNA polymerase II subunit RPB2
MGKDQYHWTHLLLDGLIEYIDCEEEETTMIATTPADLERPDLSGMQH